MLGLVRRTEMLSHGAVLALSFVLFVLVALLDLVSGDQISFSIFYLAPVSLCAWRLGSGAAIAVSILCAATWHWLGALDGHAYSSALVPYWNSAVRLGFFLIVSQLLVALRAELDRVQHLSQVDTLTGLANARAFREHARFELLRSAALKIPITVAFLDLDNFKAVNDRHGHEAGDRVLGIVARVMLGSLRSTDVAARMGGDEFAALFTGAGEAAGARVLAELQGRLRAALDDAGFDQVGVSVGACTALPPAPEIDLLLRRADEHMYEAKRAGKSRVVLRLYRSPS